MNTATRLSVAQDCWSKDFCYLEYKALAECAGFIPYSEKVYAKLCEAFYEDMAEHCGTTI